MDSQEKTANSNSSNSFQNDDLSFPESVESWITSMKEIYQAIRSERLVVFVGSGVSRNSGLPTWSGLIEKMRTLLDIPETPKELDNFLSTENYLTIAQYFYDQYKESEYQKLIKKELGKSAKSNPIDDMIFKLKPRHIVTTNYDRLLEESAENFQKNSQYRYIPIIYDNDFIHSPGLFEIPSPRYIIKLHGDIKKLDSIVLKEEDYLHYELSRPLMSTFLKALLADHSFLFIGYSLRDYNIKQIIEWINYISKKNDKKTRGTKKSNKENNKRKHYFIKVSKQGIDYEEEKRSAETSKGNPLDSSEGSNSSNSKPQSQTVISNKQKQEDNRQKLEEQRLENYGIQVINLDKIPEENLVIPDKIPALFVSNPVGGRLYLCLYHLSNYDRFMNIYCVKDFIDEKIKILNEYKQASIRDVLPLFSFNKVQAGVSSSKISNKQFSVTLTVKPDAEQSDLDTSEKNIQRRYLSQLNDFFQKGTSNPESTLVSSFSDFLQKTNIRHITIEDDQRNFVSYSSEGLSNNNRNDDDLFNLYLDNNYAKIKEILNEKISNNVSNSSYPSEETIFYGLLLDEPPKKFKNLAKSYFAKEKRCFNREKKIGIINNNEQLRFLFTQIRKYEFYRQFYRNDRNKQSDIASEKNILVQYLNSVDQDVTVTIRDYYFKGVQLEDVSLIETNRKVSKNNKSVLFYDFYLFMFMNHFPMYRKGTIKYLSPHVKQILSLKTNNDQIKINEIDFDMIVKYSNTRKLRNTLEKYGTRKLLIIEGKLSTKLNNLCKSLSESSPTYWWDYLIRFIIILTYAQTEPEENVLSAVVGKINKIVGLDQTKKKKILDKFSKSKKILKDFFEPIQDKYTLNPEILEILENQLRPIIQSNPGMNSSSSLMNFKK